MKKNKGFTLIELLVVVSIIGILTTLVVANLNSARERARDASRKSDLRNIQTALRLYYNDINEFPDSAADGSIKGCGGLVCVWGSAWENKGVTYMNILPKDPLPEQVYNYTYDDANDVYTLYACLENSSDDRCISVADSVCVSKCKYEVKP